MSEADFNAILDTPAEEIKAKPLLPVGTYSFRIKGIPKHVVSSKKKTNGFEFVCEAYEAGQDVDQEMLQAAGGLPKEMSTSFWITPDAANMLKEFCVDTLGIEGSGKTLRELIAATPGMTFLGIISHGISDSGRPFAELKKFLKMA